MVLLCFFQFLLQKIYAYHNNNRYIYIYYYSKKSETFMEYRQLNGSGLFVPALSLGTATFGGTHGFEGWGNTGVAEATRMVDMCLEAGLNLFDTADIYSRGLSEEILGKAISGKRNRRASQASRERRADRGSHYVH